ncbi:hypothetical protein [Stenotrophomonas oahuensis]|uniref:Ig-like domain-containing protein n=1 Tax=Stenotrophomonas oahuensis TaxID=3003271 RepID=A0ABY9YNE0_9GAMM|nr:hypothetical protein [Stenotrophomonas sp. A5586]WNH52422.1 hypothetical protein PDM29_19200 [Stenotrophomonas sp. A5586]
MAQIYVARNGAWNPARYLRANAATVKTVRVARGGVWVPVYYGMTASATGGNFTRNNGNSSTPRTIATAIGVSAAVSGGSGSYSYAWSVTGSSGVTAVSLANANASGCTVYATCSINGGGSVSLQCVVTDNSSGYAVVVYTSTSYNYYNTL